MFGLVKIDPGLPFFAPAFDTTIRAGTQTLQR
jgi:hypothetical protein